MHIKQGLIFIITVILLTLLVGGGYIAYRNYNKQSKADSLPEKTESALTTSDWKTSSVQSQLASSPDVFVVQDDGTLTPYGRFDTRAIAKKFYMLHPDKKNTYDFLSIFTTFRDNPFTIENHDVVNNRVKGIGLNQFASSDGLPAKLQGINFFNDVYKASHVKNEVNLKNNLFLLVHETGHQWGMYLAKNEGVSDGAHYSKWVNNGFQREGKWEGDALQGWPWKQNNDGTFSVNDITRQAFSRFSLYLMGLAPITEVPDLQVIIPLNPDDKKLANVQGTLKTIRMNDIISKYGERIPPYQDSQKNFDMAYILLTKKGEANYEPDLHVLEWIANDFSIEWNTVTYGRSTINQ